MTWPNYRRIRRFTDGDLTLLDRGARRALIQLGDGRPVALLDTLEDPRTPDPQLSMTQTELKEALGETISRLPE